MTHSEPRGISSRPHGQSSATSSSASASRRPPLTSLGCADHRVLVSGEVDCRQVVATSRFLITNVIREILGRQIDFEVWSVEEVLRFQTRIEHMAMQVKGRIARLPDPEVEGYPDYKAFVEATQDKTREYLRKASVEAWTLVPNPHNVAFLMWSRRLLSLMLEKAYCTLFQPLQRLGDKALWSEFRGM